jgi:predicted nucleotidyltransferase component of viral defense system
MINQQNISLEWINKVSKENRNADKILVEKVIRALLLLEGLSKQKLPFIFKGGTALMLHLNSTKRLSIDIDIILPQNIDNLDDILNSVAKEQGFLRQELQYRSAQSRIKKEHYCIASRGADGKGDFEQLQLGIQRIARFIFSESYHLEKAIVHASKAAYLSSLIKYDAKEVEKFKDPTQIKDWLIGEPMNNKLNKLKKSNPEAFFYWYKIYELTTQVG